MVWAVAYTLRSGPVERQLVPTKPPDRYLVGLGLGFGEFTSGGVALRQHPRSVLYDDLWCSAIFRFFHAVRAVLVRGRAVVLNAIFAATGKHIRRLLLKNHALRTA